MPESFGARLRQQREERGIALATIAQQTRIKEALLEALERDDVSQWPSGLYRRAFFRAYARAIALDPDTAVQEFAAVHPEPEVDVLKAMASTLVREGNSGMTAGFRDVVGSAIGTLARLRRPAAEETVAVAEAVTIVETVRPAPAFDLGDIARLCTAMTRVTTLADARPVLQESARLLDANGIIIWLWDAFAAHLRPALVYGYSDRVAAQLPMVRRDAANPTAAAFRTGQTRVLDGDGQCPAAVVVPLFSPDGCAGVLAIELRRGMALSANLVAATTVLAAQVAVVARESRSVVVAPGLDCATPEVSATA
jgi:transcriptional regulator with XRE-family HTH domain